MKIFLTIVVGLILLTSCTKEYSDQFVPYNNSMLDTAWKTSLPRNAPAHDITTFLSENRNTFIDSFNVTVGGTLSFADGLKIIFPPNICVGSGTSIITGNVKVELTYLKKKGDFIRFSKPTTSGDRLLQTGGSFNVKLSKNGTYLSIAPNLSYKIIYRNENPIAGMQFFYEDWVINNNDSVATWLPASTSQNSQGSVTNWQSLDSITNTIVRGYELLSRKFNWINCDFFNDTSQPATRVNLSLPMNFTNLNTQVYMVFKSKNIVVKLNSDAINKVFWINRIPINSEVTLVAISKIGTDFYLGTRNLNVTNANLINISSEIKPMSFINTYLDNL